MQRTTQNNNNIEARETFRTNLLAIEERVTPQGCYLQKPRFCGRMHTDMRILRSMD